MRYAASARWRVVTATSAVALVLAACGGGAVDDGDAAADDGDDGGDVAEGGEEGTLTVLHALTGDTDTAGLRAAFDRFTEETGVQIAESGSADFEQLVNNRIQGGSPPDIALHPQPGLMEDLVEQGYATPATEFVDLDQLRGDMVDGLVELGEVDGEFYGLMLRLSLKSLVWYSTDVFEEGGYEIPETWEDMVALSDEMVADGVTPWCIGIESSDATGWVATDWIEDIMLRLHGEDVYDDWVTNDVPFNSPEVQEAIEGYLDPIWFADDFVFGGTANILQTSFGDSVLGVFDGTCAMHRQASFIEGFFPDGEEVGDNIDFFYLPQIEEAGVGEPVLIAGDLAVAYTDNPDLETFFQYFSQPESGEPWGAEGAWLSPFVDFDSSTYADESLAAQGEIVADADFARFDGSDMMPGGVGAGAFWSEMVNYIQSGGEDLESRLEAIDAAWPSN
jgi:alpha-glucoside transport system substrate-binding protein